MNSTNIISVPIVFNIEIKSKQGHEWLAESEAQSLVENWLWNVREISQRKGRTSKFMLWLVKNQSRMVFKIMDREHQFTGEA